jgi:hypothetical protein
LVLAAGFTALDDARAVDKVALCKASTTDAEPEEIASLATFTLRPGFNVV